MKKKTVLVMCGGQSMEHEVSVITGLQVLEKLVESSFEPQFIYVDQQNQLFWLRGITSRKDFYRVRRIPVTIVSRNGQPQLQTLRIFSKQIPVSAAYLAFHGGSGECGQIQGLLEMVGVPYTSSSVEGSAIAMNKALTKEVLSRTSVPVLPWVTVNSLEYQDDPKCLHQICIEAVSLPAIVKPAHLGSSIGIEIVDSEVRLEKALSVATRLDTEVVVESALSKFVEYNISVREHNGELECSPIEEPIRESDILSFADKYTKGTKKTGGGMENLDRHLPANISTELSEEIVRYAHIAYRAMRQSGVVRIDFMYNDGKLYCTEINSIPGSMAFYLWEANGEQFVDQVIHLIDETVNQCTQRPQPQTYHTDIVQKFIDQ